MDEELTLPEATHWCPSCDVVFHEPFVCVRCDVEARPISERPEDDEPTQKIVVGRAESSVRGVLDELIAGEGLGRLEREATAEKLAELREKHVRMYAGRLRQPLRGVNAPETERLLRLWTAMEGKAFGELDEEQKLEVLDALASGM